MPLYGGRGTGSPGRARWAACRLTACRLALLSLTLPALLASAPGRAAYGLPVGPAPAADPREGTTSLPPPGSALERGLAGGEAHAYTAELAAGEFLRAVVDQRGIDLVVRLDDPSGARLFEGDSPNGERGPESLSFVAETAGVYRVGVVSLDPGAGEGTYELRVVARRPARPEDHSVVAADRLEAAAAVDAWVTATGESRRRAAEGYSQAVELWHRLGEPRREAAALNNLAVMHATLGDASQAADTFQCAISLARDLGDRADEARLLLNLASQYDALGRGHDAEQLYRASLALGDELGEPRTAAGAANGLATLLRRGGELEEALALARRSVELRRSHGIEDGEARSLNNLALILRDLGRDEEAEELFREAQPLARRSGDVETEAVLVHNLGSKAMTEGRLHEALDLYRRSRVLNRRLGDQRGELFAMSSIGRLLARLGRLAEAQAEFVQALELSRAIGDRASEGRALEFLGWVLGRSGEPAVAATKLSEALAIAREVGDRRLEMDVLRTLAQARRSAGDLDAAAEIAETLLRVARGMGNPITEAAALHERGATLAARGDPAAARESLVAALEILSSRGRPMEEVAVRLDLARTERALDRLEIAHGHLAAAVALVEDVRSGLVVPDFRASLLASGRELHDEQVDLLMELHTRHPDDGWDARALSASERARGRGLLDLLAESEVDLRQGVDPALLAQEKALRRQLADLELRRLDLTADARSENDPATTAAVSELERQIRQARDEHRWVEAEIRTASPRYAALAETDPLPAAAVRRLLDGRTLLLAYHLGPTRSFLWALTRDEQASFILPAGPALEALARDLYERIGGDVPGEPEEIRDLTARLSDALLAPAAALLVGRRLGVLADGALHYVPFAALDDPSFPDGDPPRPLVAGHEIVHLPSASTLAALRTGGRRGPEASHTLALIADPVFQGDDPRLGPEHATRSAGRADGYRRLRFSRQEADRLAELVPLEERFVAYDFEASRETVTGDRLADYRLVHFATHGILNAEMPELSGLVLSLVGTDGTPRDGFLRLQDIYELRLDADLVTLSACRTALGQEVRGEGLVGLARGFMYAGASRVVASLWDVEDRATAELMTRFYRGMLEEGRAPAAALRAAQAEMWSDERWRDPYYWAAFVLVGPWD